MPIPAKMLAMSLGILIGGIAIMAEAKSTIATQTVTCIVPGKSAVNADALCKTFVERLSLARPDNRFVVAGQGEVAQITLDMTRLAPNGLEGRILQADGLTGPLVGMAIADRVLDAGQIAEFLDRLITSLQH